jgi:hypothetical protein
MQIKSLPFREDLEGAEFLTKSNMATIESIQNAYIDYVLTEGSAA